MSRKYYSRFDESINPRRYVHLANKGQELHDKVVGIMKSFVAEYSPSAQKLIHSFKEYKKAMSEPVNLGKQKSSSSLDVITSLHNIFAEMHLDKTKTFQSIGSKMEFIEEALKALDMLLADIINFEPSESLSDLQYSKNELRERKRLAAGGDPKPPRTGGGRRGGGGGSKTDTRVDPPVDTVHPDPADPTEQEYQRMLANLPAEGSEEWHRWVALRAHHIQQQKEKAHRRGDTSRGDELHGHDWWDHKAHWHAAADEVKRYIDAVRSRKHDGFTWEKHYKDWRRHIGQAINEYRQLRENQEKDFMKSILPSKKTWFI